MNSLVHSGHALCNVEQYPINRRIRFKLNSGDSVNKISKQLDDDMVINRSDYNHHLKVVRDSVSELDSLSDVNVKAELKSLSKESALLERSFSRRGLLKRFLYSADKFGLSTAEISFFVKVLYESPSELDFNLIKVKIVDFLMASPFVVNRLRFFEVRKRWKFLYSPNAVSNRRSLLQRKIDESNMYLGRLSDELVMLSNIRSEFDKYVSDLKHLQSADYIFGLYDNEMILQKRFTSYLNLSVDYIRRVLSDIDSLGSNFGLHKYFVVDSLDGDSLWRGVVSRYDSVEYKKRYADFTRNLRIVSFTQQLSSLLSNFLDLNIINDRIREVSKTGLVSDVEVAFLNGLIVRIRAVIDFCVWLFEQDFSDTRSFSERQSAWVSDQLAKADRVESSGGSVDSLIGGSLRHRTFRKNV